MSTRMAVPEDTDHPLKLIVQLTGAEVEPKPRKWIRVAALLTSAILGGAIVAVYVTWNPRATDRADSAGVQVELGAFIRSVKEELFRAEVPLAGGEETPALKIKSVDIEVSVLTKLEKTDSGSLEIKLVTLGRENKNSSEQSQKVVLHLDPVAGQTIVQTPRRSQSDLLTTPPPPKEKKP